jgi:hypothetical protein
MKQMTWQEGLMRMTSRTMTARAMARNTARSIAEHCQAPHRTAQITARTSRPMTSRAMTKSTAKDTAESTTETETETDNTATSTAKSTRFGTAKSTATSTRFVMTTGTSTYSVMTWDLTPGSARIPGTEDLGPGTWELTWDPIHPTAEAT